MTHRITRFALDDLDYIVNRVAMYNELPTKGQLLTFLFEVEDRIGELEYAAGTECPECGYDPTQAEDDE